MKKVLMIVAAVVIVYLAVGVVMFLKQNSQVSFNTSSANQRNEDQASEQSDYEEDYQGGGAAGDSGPGWRIITNWGWEGIPNDDNR